MSTVVETRQTVSLRQLLLPIAGWIAALFGTLQLHQQRMPFDHITCGPWVLGCGPPLSALLGYHSFWLVLASLPAWVCTRVLVPAILHRLSLALLAVSFAGMLALLAFDQWVYWQSIAKPEYIAQRVLFCLVTSVDFPFVQLGLVGLWWRKATRSRQTVSQSAVTGN